MPRKKITNLTKKKAKQQAKRAIKRGDEPPPPKPAQKKKSRHGHAARSTLGENQESARKLQSAFVKLPPEYLETTKNIASHVPLPRPLPTDSSVLSESQSGQSAETSAPLTCPKRPKWKFDMSKTEVEKNEEGVFNSWLAQADHLVEEWQKEPLSDAQPPSESDVPVVPEPPTQPPRAPIYFERNIEVWRQLWRVTEISDIILVLVDSRCPILHYPPSLHHYLADRKVILVLTKVDIAGPERTDAWTSHFSKQYPSLRIVQVKSYGEREPGYAQQGRTLFQPHIPATFRDRLVDAIKAAHSELLQPPEEVKSDPKRMQHWKSTVKREIDWETVRSASDAKAGSTVGGALAPMPEEHRGEDGTSEAEPSFLTVGVIGQPNVGKSSLLNALFGASKVRASKTPGKTKHFQTLFWSPDIRLVDCPGLVMPNYVRMEMQVLAGILPISRVSAVPACIHFACQYVPLERVLDLTHPDAEELALVEDKRTWRDGTRREVKREPVWKAMDVLTAYALKKGWVTAKAGRPDIHRAGNALLRSLAEGNIGWAFWPSDTAPDTLSSPEDGIWIPQAERTEDDGESSEPTSDEEDEEHGESTDGTGSEEEDGEELSEDEDEDGEDEVQPAATQGRFGALVLEDVTEEE